MSASLEHIEELLMNIEAIANDLRVREPVGGNQITINGVDDLSENLGLMKAGEFRSGMGVPGKGTGFTGIRLGAPGWLYEGTRYSIVGLNEDVLQFGMSNEDGTIYAGAGAVRLNVDGIYIVGDGTGADINKLRFYYDDSGTPRRMTSFYADWGGGPGGTCVTWLYARRDTGAGWDDSMITLIAIDTIAGDDVRLNIGSNGTVDITGASVFQTATSVQVEILKGLAVGVAADAGIGNIEYTSNLISRKNSTNYTGYIFVPSHPPFVHADWTADAKAADADGIIDLSTFSDGTNNFPAGAKAVYVRLTVKDETAGVLIQLGADSGHVGAVTCRTQIANQADNSSGIVPCDANGDIYIDFEDEVDECTIQIWGYFL